MKQLLVRISRKAQTLIKRGLNVAVAACLLGSMGAASLPLASVSAQNLTPAPRVSFTFDDGLTSALTEAAPVLNAHGFAGTNYIITDCVGTVGTCPAEETADYMTWDQIAHLNATYGWEIGSHTVSHPQLDTDGLTQAQVTEQLANSKQALTAKGYAANSFAAPYGDYSNMVRAEAAKYYTSFRGFHDLGANIYPYNDQLIVVQQVQDGVTVDQVKAYVDAAKASNQWLVLVFHEVKQTTTGNPDDYQYSTANLDAIAQYVQDQNVQVTTMSNGLATGTNNLVANGSFDSTLALGAYTGTPSATEWTTDATANIAINTANNGSYPGPTNSISFTAGAANAHLFSPLVTVSASQSYLIKSFLNVASITSGELGYYIHEYDANGAEIGGQWKKAEVTAFVENINLTYTPTSAAVVKASLEIYVTANSGITAYVDSFEWFSVNEVVPPADTTAPVISGVTPSNTATGATITWTTNEAADSIVNYGISDSYGSQAQSTGLTTAHSLILSGLIASTTYHYQVISKDAAGNPATSVDMTFTTSSTTTPGVKTGDANGDGFVDALDYSTVLSNWGTGTTKDKGDVNGDAVVDALDLSTVLSNWGK